ncbi:MAG: hypothetical protein JWM74_6128, partial [Myxococcaceae bacterium]|nr:hypothetical protein [Myxococcaceae bacterium]
AGEGLRERSEATLSDRVRLAS